jgi:type II restriction/modification system DNA methylase subunit YeeA
VGPTEFAAKWQLNNRPEHASAQEHFIDLCAMLEVATPIAADPNGDWYAFEKGASKVTGGNGWADVWKLKHFAWEYKGKHKDLKAAYKQLLDYRDALENPPLLVVCDLDRFEIRTNWTNTPTTVHSFALADLASDPAEPLRVLRAVMSDPEELHPREEATALTRDAAERFAKLAVSLRARHEDPLRVAHFLDKLLFCFFAEDTAIGINPDGVLPKGLVSRLLTRFGSDPVVLTQRLGQLFADMNTGGYFGDYEIAHINGGLFADADVLELTRSEIQTLVAVSKLDWAKIEPAIFGTLFERGLDPDKRTQLGAHYTDRAAIDRLVEPVVMAPLRREYEAMVAAAEALLAAGDPKSKRRAIDLYEAFLVRLRAVRVLDPACGSGNFLYVALRKLKDLEHTALHWASLKFQRPIEAFLGVGPENVLGIEINPYAAELARITIWIGEIQWMIEHGYRFRDDPVLRPLDQIARADALLDRTDPAHPQEALWPDAEFIIGNPPFLGGKLLRRSLGDAYVESLFKVYEGRVPQEADLVTYWHEKARSMVASGHASRVGLLATQGIRGGANRKVIEQIKGTGDLFLAWSDEPWVLDGANVHVSFLGYDDGSETARVLNGRPVAAINANLTAGLDLSLARRLKENLGIAFMGDTKGGAFDITAEQAARMLAAKNPDGRSNADVVRPRVNGLVSKGGASKTWVIDFGTNMSEEQAALYEAPFEYIRWLVKPQRDKNRRAAYRERWWIHVEPRPAMRAALTGLPRFIVTVIHSKHRLFWWEEPPTLPDHALIVFARDDDVTMGVLHSRVHEVWARALGTQVRDVRTGFRYTPTTCFETFPSPDPSPDQAEAIGSAARWIVAHRDKWLAIVGPTETGEERTLTTLYNQKPSWLAMAHTKLDVAVLASYGWPDSLPDDQILARLLELNLARTGKGAVGSAGGAA